jgi:hypothetical protein
VVNRGQDVVVRKAFLAAVAVLAGCGTGTVATQALAHLLVPSGKQTATIRIDLTGSSPPSFSGDIAGQPLTGRYSNAPASGRQLCTQGGSLMIAQTFMYSGTYDGRAYSFEGCTSSAFLHGNTVVTMPTAPPPSGPSGTPNSMPSITGMRLVFRVTGHVGSAAMSGSATWTIKNVDSSCDHAGCSFTMPFSGSIGSQKLTGTATITEESRRVGLIVAKLTVS